MEEMLVGSKASVGLYAGDDWYQLYELLYNA